MVEAAAALGAALKGHSLASIGKCCWRQFSVGDSHMLLGSALFVKLVGSQIWRPPGQEQLGEVPGPRKYRP